MTTKTLPMQAVTAAAPRYLFLVKVEHRGQPVIHEVRQYPSKMAAVVDALLRYDDAWPVAVRQLGGAL